MQRRASLPALLLSLTVTAAAQQYAHLAGVVVDPSGGAVSDASLTAVNEETGFRRAASTRHDGTYLVASLQPGSYKITVRKEGFRTVVRFGVRLELAQTARVDFALPVGSMHESVTVEGTAPLLNSEDGSVGTLIGRDRIDRLPLNGRGILTLLELAPGTVVTPATRGESGQFTTNGQRPNAHYFTVDGIGVNTGVSGGAVPAQATGGSLPGLTAFGSLHSIAPLEALDEFRVQTSSVGAEFGRLPGAQVSLSTRSGSNELHGSLFYNFRHEKLAANDWFANRGGFPRAPLRFHDAGASLGGPVRRDRTFFFLSYEGMRLRQPAIWRASVPSLQFRSEAPDWAEPLLELFPSPNGPALSPDLGEWTATSSRPSRLDSGNIRLDHALTSRITLFARYSEAPSATEFGVPQVNELSIASRSVTGASDVRIKPWFVLSVRANVSRATGDSFWRIASGALPPCALQPVLDQFGGGPEDCNALVRFSISGVGQLVAGTEGSRRQSQSQISAAFYSGLGGHQLRGGIDRRRLLPVYDNPTGALTAIAEDIEDIRRIGNMWVSTSPSRHARSELTELSAFLQDSWRIRPGLNAVYGVRWDYNPAPEGAEAYYPNPDPEQGPAQFGTAKLWKAGYGSFAPRLGVSWRPRSEGAWVLRAGAGLFYDSSLSIATDVVNGGPLAMTRFLSGRTAPFASVLSYGFDLDFRMPRVFQWNAAVERALSKSDAVSAAYVGSAGRRLIRREIGSTGDELFRVALATNRGSSNYHALQLQYRRRMAGPVQAAAAYSWSHSIDNGSSDSVLQWAAPPLTAALDRASSDFDVRHSAAVAVAWDLPARRFLQGWSLDGVFHARTGFPINITTSEQVIGLSFSNAFRPDLAGAVPVWLGDPSVPGGIRLNRAAFAPRPYLKQGNLGRNALSGFGMTQLDLAARREFRLRDRAMLQLRVEAFNALNRASLADPVSVLSSPLFGQSPSMLNLMLGSGSPGSGLAPMFQAGGPRSVQAGLRVRF